MLFYCVIGVMNYADCLENFRNLTCGDKDLGSRPASATDWLWGMGVFFTFTVSD